MIFASRTTCRSTINCMAFRNDSTERSSAGIARITITPDWELTITLRPSAVPTIAVSDFTMSPQKLLSEEVVTRVLSAVRDVDPPVVLPGGVAVPGVGDVSVIEPEL